MRKLVSIRNITDIAPIPGADNIEVVTIDGGWKVVSKKNEFAIGDECVYFEIDSVLPIRPEFEFLRKSSYIKTPSYEGFRLRTIKLRKQISQGLALPIHIFQDATLSRTEDLTNLLGVIKWEPTIPIQLSGDVVGKFPDYIPKTDQERIQNLSSEIKEWAREEDNLWEVTEKLEGQSMTIFFKWSHENSRHEIGVCTRNWQIKEDQDSTLWKIARKIISKDLLDAFATRSLALQGEFIGPGVQGNIYKLTENRFVVFDIYDIDISRYFQPVSRKNLCDSLGLDHVPVIHENFAVVDNIEKMLEYADGTSAINSSVLREGLVYKYYDGEKSFKTISNAYLLKEVNA